jgi:hypothetical protein
MKTITVSTGFGLLTQSGSIVAKAELPIGTHLIPDYLDYTEVNSKTELDGIIFNVPAPAGPDLIAELDACQTVSDLKLFIRNRLL